MINWPGSTRWPRTAIGRSSCSAITTSWDPASHGALRHLLRDSSGRLRSADRRRRSAAGHLRLLRRPHPPQSGSAVRGRPATCRGWRWPASRTIREPGRSTASTRAGSCRSSIASRAREALDRGPRRPDTCTKACMPTTPSARWLTGASRFDLVTDRTFTSRRGCRRRSTWPANGSSARCARFATTSGTCRVSVSGPSASSSRTPCGRFGRWTSTSMALVRDPTPLPSAAAYFRTVLAEDDPHLHIAVRARREVPDLGDDPISVAEALAEHVGRIAERAPATHARAHVRRGHRAARLPRDASGRVGRAHARSGRGARVSTCRCRRCRAASRSRFWPTSWRTTTSVMCSSRSPAGPICWSDSTPWHDRIRRHGTARTRWPTCG